MNTSPGRAIGTTHRGRAHAALALATVGLLALGACGGGGDDSSSGGTRQPEASTSTSAAPTTAAGAPSTTGGVRDTTPPAAGAQTLTASSRLGLDGIGAVKVNMTVDQASAATGMPFRLEPDLGNDCRYAEAEGGPVGLSFMVIGGHIVRVDVSGHPSPSPITTVSGIKIGSTEDEVKAAYPDAIEVTPHPYVETGHYLAYKSSDPALGLIFETDGQRVTSFRSGLAGAVQAIEGCA